MTIMLHPTIQALQEEITSRKPDVDQAVKKGQALLKQSTGEEMIDAEVLIDFKTSFPQWSNYSYTITIQKHVSTYFYNIFS